MTTTFKIGDTVRLKSGGPLMTVVYVGADGKTIDCNWFVDDKPVRNSYPPEALEISKPPQPRLPRIRP